MRRPVGFRESDRPRIQWMLAHQGAWERFPEHRWTYSQHHLAVENDLKKRMKAEGLYSTSTYLGDIKIYRLIALARQIRREGWPSAV